MCLLIHFVLYNVNVLFGNSKFYASIFEFFSVKYNYVALLLGYIQVYLHPEVLDFLPINFHTFCPYLESLTCFHGKDLIVQSLYVHLKDRKAGWK